MWRRFTLLLLAATTSGSLGTNRPARAQDEVEPGDKQPVQPRPPVATTDQQFELFYFRQFGGVEGTRRRLERRLTWEIKRVGQFYRLTPELEQKLEVAGHGDIKRFFERVREKQEILNRAGGNRVQFRALSTEVRFLTNDVHDKIFIEGSMFVKTLKMILGPEQRKRYEEKRLAFYRSRVEWVVTTGLEFLRLRDDQQRGFIRLIVAETPPLKRYGTGDFDAVLIQASRLPEEKLKPIFNESQWKRLLVKFEDVKRLEKTLIWEGYLLQDEPVDPQDPVSSNGVKLKPADARIDGAGLLRTR